MARATGTCIISETYQMALPGISYDPDHARGEVRKFRQGEPGLNR